jgi:diaminopimelate decarboxylase
VAQAGITLYTVGVVKPVTQRTYMAVDGGMSDNPRPVLYGSGYEAFDVDRPLAERPQRARLVGKHCESGDVLIDEAYLPDVTGVGSLVATPVTGAYGYSMASNYNRVPRPAVVFVRDGLAREVLRRETFEDLARLEVEN